MSWIATWARPLLLEIESLGVSYGRMVAATGINMQVKAGSLVALIGANGAGKSSVLRAISGLMPVRGGRVTFDGTVVSGRPAHEIARLGLCHVPEGRGLLPTITVAENLRIGAYGNAAFKAADMDRVLEYFPGLRDRMKQPASLLSGGEQQMLSLARALLKGPKLLMIDEMSLGLAPKLVGRLLDVIVLLKQQGLTILCVEQRTKLIFAKADYVYGLKNGRVLVEGSPATLECEGGIDRLYITPHS